MSQIIARFTGIAQMRYCRGSRTLGPFPDAALAYFIPQDIHTLDGTLTFTSGGDVVQWPNAHIDRVSQRRTTRGGILMSAVILDRRVWWKFAVVDGVYNERNDSGNVGLSTDRSPQQLAAILLTAGGESDFDVSALPNDPEDRPYVNWVGANPFYELHRLCRERGCDIRYGLDDRVSIVRLGVGAPLPIGGRRSVDQSIDASESPAVVRAYCGETIAQGKLRLEAVAPDEYGVIRLVSSILSDWGWEIEDPDDLFPEEADQNKRRIAKQYFFKLWRVKDQAHAPGTYDPPGYTGTTIPSIGYLLPLFGGLADTYSSPDSEEARPPVIEGVYLPRSEVRGESADANTDEGTPIDCSFTLNRTVGIFTTSKPMLKIKDDNSGYEAAELVALVAYPITNPLTFQHTRHILERSRPVGVGTYPLRLDDLQLRLIARYEDEDNPNDVTSIDNNQSTTEARMAASMDALETQWDTLLSASAEYQGIRAIDVSGSVRQVSWRVSCKQGEGASTWGSLNVESDPYTMTERYRARLAAELARSQDVPWRTRRRRARSHRPEGE